MPKVKEPAAAKPSRSAKPNRVPTHEEIALRAYKIYLRRAGAPGNALDDWTRAERELLQEPSKPRSKNRRKVKPISIAA